MNCHDEFVGELAPVLMIPSTENVLNRCARWDSNVMSQVQFMKHRVLQHDCQPVIRTRQRG